LAAIGILSEHRCQFIGSTNVISSTTSAFLEGPTYCLIDIDNLSPEPIITSKSYSGVCFVQVFQLSKSSIETQSCLTNFDQTVFVNNPTPLQIKDIQICLYCHVQNLPGVNHPFNTLGIPFILILEIL